MSSLCFSLSCDRYVNIIRDSQDKEKHKDDKDFSVKPIACVYGLIYSFGSNGYEHNIPGNSIWVQGRLYNRKFINKYDIHFLIGESSRQGEDYPFIRKLDYAIQHDDSFSVLSAVATKSAAVTPVAPRLAAERTR